MRFKLLILCALSVYGCLGVDQQQSCDDQCSPSYPLHTYPKPAYNVACARGCRLAFVEYYTSSGQTKSCNQTCSEAYTNDAGAMYACTVGCTVNVDAAIGDDSMNEVTLISNMMDLMLLSRLVDLLSISCNNIPVNEGDSNELNDEVDVYMPEGFNSANSSADGTTASWSVYSMVWFMDSAPSEVTTSTDDVTDMSDTSSNGYYLVYYKHWSLTEFGFLSQLLCYITLFLFMVALLKCCHVLLSEGDDDDDSNKLSVSADYDTDLESEEDEETAELLRRKKEKSFVSDLQSQIVRMPSHIGRPAISMSSFLPVQDTRISGSKVEGILTVV